MKLSCLHTHTTLCDGTDDIETFCRKAYEKGMDSIGFSAHAPITAKTGIKSDWNLPEDKLNEYLYEVKMAKKRWEGRLPVYLGLEIDFIEGLMGPDDKDYAEMELDYKIGGVHYIVPSEGKHFTVDNSAEAVEKAVTEFYYGDFYAMISSYYDAVSKMIKKGSFDILAHPDVVKKNNSDSRYFSETDPVYIEKAASLAPLISAQKLHCEINTGGMNRGRIKDCYPSLWLLKIFNEYDIPIVINSDAHEAEDLDGNYTTACHMLKTAGYSSTAIFKGRTNNTVQWEYIAL